MKSLETLKKEVQDDLKKEYWVSLGEYYLIKSCEAANSLVTEVEIYFEGFTIYAMPFLFIDGEKVFSFPHLIPIAYQTDGEFRIEKDWRKIISYFRINPQIQDDIVLCLKKDRILDLKDRSLSNSFLEILRI